MDGQGLHFDKGIINQVDTMPNGMLRVLGTIAQVGWLEYHNDKKDVRMEYVPKETLFDEEHLRSIAGAVLTLGHPQELVTPKNYKKYTVGSTGTKIIKVDKPDVQLVDIVTVVCDESAIRSIQDGKTTKLSMGYLAETKQISDNEFMQTKRLCNHNAFVEQGRAPLAGLYLDGWVNTGFKPDYKSNDKSITAIGQPSKNKYKVVSIDY